MEAQMRTTRTTSRLSLATGLAVAALALAACGGDGGSSPGEVAAPPDDLNAPATGTLRVFAYGDTVPDKMLDPFREANPDLDLQVATFNSNKAAAAKLAGGFQADVVEVCTDEMEPLTARGLLQALDETAIKDFDELAFADRDDIRDEAGNVLFVPASAGPHGLIVNTDEVDEDITSYQSLFDTAYTGRSALESTPLTAIGVTALALGMDDPMNLSTDEIEEVKQYILDNRDTFRSFVESDSDLVNLFKSGEVVIADGGRGTTQDMVDDGVPVEWIAPDEGALSWVCGLAITSDAENIPAAYKLIDYYASPEAQAISAELGFVAMNPKALELLPKDLKDTADPRNLDQAIPQVQPDAADAYDRAWQEVAAG
jgi:spermidine/putrescine transport system substrate-binding protein